MSLTELQPGADLTDQDVANRVTDAAQETAKDLLRAGFDEAWAEGPDVYARKGKQTFIMRNQVQRGHKGNRDKMLDLFAAMVVRRLTIGMKG